MLQFKPEVLYPTNPNLNALQDPFTDLEIDIAVQQLARNKVSGPDGIPNEFLQTHWSVVKENVTQLIHGFYNHSIDLSNINHANIVMIPKKEICVKVSDYRPISIMNAILNLVSKILANRLRDFLPVLIVQTQTAFIGGRQISENFNATREILHHISESGRPACSLNWTLRRRSIQLIGHI